MMNMMIIIMIVMIMIKNANQCCRLLGNFCGETFIENSHSAKVIISLKDGSCGVDLSARKHRKFGKDVNDNYNCRQSRFLSDCLSLLSSQPPFPQHPNDSF